MTRRRRPPAPWWFGALVAVGLALVCRALDLRLGSADGPALAFWFWIILIAQWVWQGAQAVAQVTLAFVHWLVLGLQHFVGILQNGLIDLGKTIQSGFRESWTAIRSLYDNVLKPAWEKFWRLIDRVRDTFERVLKPVIDFLARVRQEILSFYTKWVRPILDSLEIARKALRVFSTLGFEWAKKLDEKLGQIEEAIDRPFRIALAELNKIINLVNRVVTANGLFQRLALIRSIERDIRYVSRAFANWRLGAVTDDDYNKLKAASGARTLDDVRRDTEEALLSDGGRWSAIIAEAEAQWRLYLGGP